MPLAVNKSGTQSFRASCVGTPFTGSFQQRASEEITYFIDYSRWLADGSTISGVIFSIGLSTSPALVISAPTIVATGDGALFKISGGLTGSKYAIDIIATTSDGQVKIDTIYLSLWTASASATWAGVVYLPLPLPSSVTLGGIIAASAPPDQVMTGVSVMGEPIFSQISIAAFNAAFLAWMASLPVEPGAPGSSWNNSGTPSVSQ